MDVLGIASITGAGTGATERRHRDDERRFAVLVRCHVDARLLYALHADILQQHVRPVASPLDHVTIRPDTPLAVVGALKIGRSLWPPDAVNERAVLAIHVEPLGVFDPHDHCAESAQNGAGERTGQNVGELKDVKVGQRPSIAVLLRPLGD